MPEPELIPPYDIPGYELLGRLAVGTSSVLFDARQLATGRHVVVKVVAMTSLSAEEAARRMETEWQVGRALRHPHLVQFFDAARSPDGGFWLAMERLDGHDLQLELGRRGRLHPTRATQITLQLCHALEVLHRRNVVHRDIKPSNIFLCTGRGRGDHVKLVDLGMLSVAKHDPDRAHPPTGQIVLGTPYYQSPEHIQGHKLSARADVYAVGVLMYQLLTGRLPFEGDIRSVMDAHVNQTPAPVDGHGVRLPPSLVELVHQCLLKQPDGRPANATALRQRLLAILAEVHAFCDVAAEHVMGGIPELPPLDQPRGRARFRDGVSDWLERIWPDGDLPDGVSEGLESLDEVEKQLAKALTDANQQRTVAGEQALEMQAERRRLEAELRAADAAMAESEQAYTKTVAVLSNAAQRTERANRRYRAAVELLENVISGASGGLDRESIGEASADLEEARELWAEGQDLASKAHMRGARQRKMVGRLRQQCTNLKAALMQLDTRTEAEGAEVTVSASRAEERVEAARRNVEYAYLCLFVDILKRVSRT